MYVQQHMKRFNKSIRIIIKVLSLNIMQLNRDLNTLNVR